MAVGYLHGQEIEEITDYVDDAVILKLAGDDFYTVCLTQDIEVEDGK